MKAAAIWCAAVLWVGSCWAKTPFMVGPIQPSPNTVYAPLPQTHTVEIPGNYVADEPLVAPKLVMDVDGFLELKFMRRNQSPQTATGNRLSVIRQSMAYRQLPPDVVANTSFRNDNRYDLALTGQYGDDMSIRFHVSKEPDFDMITDILLKYKTLEVFLGDFSASFDNGSFINLNRSLNGLLVQGRLPDKQWQGQFVMGREKSKPKRVTFYGNGGTDYSLPNRNLLDGSVKVLINNQETSAYQVNYTTGTIQFDSPKTDAQFIKVLYEFTNPIADFLPAARSRKSFIGGEFDWQPKRLGWQEPVTDRATVGAPVQAVVDLPHNNAVIGSETVVFVPETGDPVPLERIVDYDMDYRDGRLRFKHPMVSANNTLQIQYDYYTVQSHTETIVGNDSRGPVYLAHQPIMPRSVSVKLNQRVLLEHYDYTVRDHTGQLYFAYPIRYPDTLVVQYDTIRQKTRYGSANETEQGFRIKASYMNEFVRADDAQSPSVTETLVPSNNHIILSNTPVNIDSVQVTDSNGNTIAVDSVNAYTGTVRLQSGGGSSVSVTYQYRSSQQMIGVLRLNQASGPTVKYRSDFLGDMWSLPALPVNYNSIQRVVVNPGTPYAIELNSHAYHIDYLNQGNAVEMQLFKASDSEASQQSNLTETLPMGTLIYVYYQTPSDLESGSMLDNKTYGVSAGYDWGDRGNIDVEVALAENNFQRKISLETETNVRQDATGRYQLMNTNIVEGSEIIQIKKPGTSGTILNRNSDYSINYIQGSFRFQTLTVSTADVVDVTYEYYESGDGAQQTQSSGAYRVRGTYGLTDRMRVSGHTMAIDNAFKPVGTMTESSGTQLWGGRLDYAPTHNRRLFSKLEKRRVHRPNSNDNSVYNNNQQIVVGSDQWVWRGIQTQFQYEQQRTTERQPVSTNYKIDEQIDRGEAQVAFGPQYLKTTINTQRSTKVDSAKDKTSYLDQYDIKTVYNQADVLWIDHINVTGMLARSHSKHAEPNTNSSREVNTKKLHSVVQPSSTTRIQFDSILDTIHTQNQTQNGRQQYLESVPEFTGKISYRPYYWLDTNFQYRDKAYESPVLGQQGRHENRQLYQIDRLEVYPMLVSLNQPWMSDRLQFFRRSNLTASYSIGEDNQNNRRVHTSNDTLTYAYRDFSPVSFMTIRNISGQTLRSNTNNRVQSGDQQQSKSSSRTNDLSGDVVFRYNRLFWRHWEYGYTIDTQQIHSTLVNRYQVDGQAETSATNNDQTVRDTTHKLSFSPGSVHLGAIPLGPLDVTVRRADATSQYTSQTRDRQDIANTTIDNAVSDETQVAIQASPYNRYRTRLEWGQKTQFFSRNMIVDQRGTFLNTDQDIALRVSMPIAQRLSLTTAANWYTIDQYSKLDSIVSRSAVQQSTRYDERLAQQSNAISADMDWRWRSWLSLTAGGSRLTKQESQHQPDPNPTQARNRSSKFSQLVGRSGFVWRPWSFMDLDYDYSYKTADVSTNPGSKTGQSHAVSIKMHKKQPFITVDVTLDWVYTNGQDFNVIDQNTLRSSAGLVTNLAVRNREDYVRNMSVNIDINVPTKVQFVDKVTVTGSGYFSSVVDRIAETNSYDVGGIIITTRVDF